MIDVNVTGAVNGVAAVLPTFVAQKSGHILATSSVAGLKAYPGGAIYGSTKWFLRNFMEVLRMGSASEGTNIRTSTLYPAADKHRRSKTSAPAKYGRSRWPSLATTSASSCR
jgi:NADP-dependent 3-hydroxy acid dehydrogenase YdfG